MGELQSEAGEYKKSPQFAQFRKPRMAGIAQKCVECRDKLLGGKYQHWCNPMRILTIAGRLLAISVLACSSAKAQVPEKQDIAELVRRLPANGLSGSRDQKLIEKIAAFGDSALPALEKELRLGIRFQELNQLLIDGQSKRGAVVEVLDRMSSERSTELLVASLNDSADTYGMRVVTLNAVSKRKLTADQIVRILKNHEPDVVLVGISHAKDNPDAKQVMREVERIFDKENARTQFHNEFGAVSASDDALWAVRLAAGKALNADMVAEMRTRAGGLLAELKSESTNPTDPDKAVWLMNCSKAENTICSSLQKLAQLGEPIKSQVEEEIKRASGDYAKVLNMAMVYLGDRSRVAQVADDLLTSKSHTIRFCAASTLRAARDRSALAVLRKALQDPYQRESGSDISPMDKKIYPIRIIVADALIDLGEDPVEVRKAMRKD
jgi:HEAT repeat protein